MIRSANVGLYAAKPPGLTDEEPEQNLRKLGGKVQRGGEMKEERKMERSIERVNENDR